jgi:DNA-binding NtrC family response regulator
MEQRSLLYVAGHRGETVIPTPLLANSGWKVCTACDAEETIALLRSEPLDVGLAELPPSSREFGRSWGQVHQARPHMKWIALVPVRSVRDQHLREAIYTFFYDYHTIPVDLDRLFATLGHAYGMAAIGEAASRRGGTDGSSQRLVGTSAAMRGVQGAIHMFASVEAPVLITGESGTGKELVALQIHQRSRRAEGPFVPINCGALPATLIQSELFGYEKGAFTGATARRRGRILEAAEGTLFLDEIGDLPYDLQSNLLRALQEGYIEPLGNGPRIEVDFRIIAATNRNLPQAIAEGRFREDLYYRLQVLNLELPPLRERREDIEPLAAFFFSRFLNETPRVIAGFSSEALNVMKHHHDWPGNVRELLNCVRRAVILCETRYIKPSDLGLEKRRRNQSFGTLNGARLEAEKAVISRTLRSTSYNMAKAARLLCVSRGTLYTLCDKFGFDLRSGSRDTGHTR